MHKLFWLFLSVVIALTVSGATHAAECSSDTAQAKQRYTLKRVNLRSCPSTYCDVLVTLPAGQSVIVYRDTDGWSMVNVKELNLTGSIYSKLLSKNCIQGNEITRSELSRTNITKILITRSRSRYSGSCPCPYNSDRAGRRCGGRSAYSRPGGVSPLCYSGDISSEMIEAFRKDRKR